MDRRVKERLVGATILVVLIVLVVPELLSGPKPAVAPALPVAAPEPVRNVTVDLATSKAPAAEAPAVTPTASSSPLPGAPSGNVNGAVGNVDTNANAGTNATSGSNTGPNSGGNANDGATPTTAARPAAGPSGSIETATRAPISPITASRPSVARVSEPAEAGHRAWVVQLGSFASRANADKLMHRLKAQGFPVYVLSGGSGAAPRYRVRIGPMADRGAATQTVAKLKSLGHVASIVPPAP